MYVHDQHAFGDQSLITTFYFAHSPLHSLKLGLLWKLSLSSYYSLARQLASGILCLTSGAVELQVCWQAQLHHIRCQIWTSVLILKEHVFKHWEMQMKLSLYVIVMSMESSSLSTLIFFSFLWYGSLIGICLIKCSKIWTIVIQVFLSVSFLCFLCGLVIGKGGQC